MKNKKAGILTPEILKIMLALIVIFFLILLSYNIYSAITKKTEKEQARATLNAIIGKIETLDKGEKTSYIVTAPKGWSLVFYGKGENKPKECKDGDYCLCMCEGNFLRMWHWELPECKSLICKTTKKEISLGTVFEETSDGLKEHKAKSLSFLNLPFPIFFQESLGTIYLTSSSEVASSYQISPAIENFLSQKMSFSSKDISFDGTMYDFLKLVIKNKVVQNKEIAETINKTIKEYSKEIEKNNREVIFSMTVTFLKTIHGDKIYQHQEFSYRSTEKNLLNENFLEKESGYKKFVVDSGAIEIKIGVFKK